MDKFDSIYSPGKKVSPAQFLAEFMCGRQARAKGQGDLPLNFWKTNKVLEKEYLKQIRFANSLIRVYNLASISAALRSKKGKKVFSLGANFLDDIIKEEEHKLKLIEDIKVEPQTEQIVDNTLPINTRPAFGKKSLKDKLDG